MRALAHALASAAAPRARRLVPLATGTGGSALYCVHAMGGSVLTYKALAKHLSDRSVLGIQASGVEAGEQPTGTVEGMAGEYATEIGLHQPEGPIHLLGWSFGGVIAFETARFLRARGRVVTLILVDSRLPAELASGRDEVEAAKSFCRDLCRVSPPPEVVHRWAEAADLAEEIARYVDSTGVMGEALDRALLVRLYAVYRAHWGALRSHRPAPSEGDAILVTAKRTTPETTPGLWRALVNGTFEVRELDGDHFTVMDDPLVGSIAGFVRESMGV